ncbi:hypothetical protein F5Y08DRAFT_333925 [Xylaria arbuscula]|nr:hypothetical protein F5Y08DRAFT_333925 [Xylaria arbuscula]
MCLGDTCHDSSSSISKRRRTTMRPPSSVCFPLRTQDRILTQAQKLLEQACFEFCRRAMPDMLDRNQWDCVEAVELNRWVPELRLRQRELFGGYHDKLLQSMTDLRHTAVHRVRVTVQRLELFLLNAEKFTALLKDGTRQEMLARIRLKTQDVIRTLESRQGVLGSKRDEVERARAIKIAELDRVRATAIAELDRIRATAIAELDKEESEYQLSAVKPLEEILFPSATPTPMATVQGGEGRVTEDDSTESYLDPCRDSESQDIQG